MTTENDGKDPEARIKSLKEHSDYLRKQLSSKAKECINLRDEVARWKRIAEEEHTSWIRTHNALNLLHQDAQAVFNEHSAAPLRRELGRLRYENSKLQDRLTQRRELTRRAVNGVVEARQMVSEMQETIDQLLARLDDVEHSRTEAAERAQEIIAQRDEQVRRFKGWCERWLKGEVGSTEVLAALTMMLNCDLTIEASMLDRRRAVEQARTQALMNESTDCLHQIVEVLAGEGVELVDTPLQMVQEYIRRVKEGSDD